MCERAHCHVGETNCCSSTCLDVCAECPPSAASKPHTKTCHWRVDQGVRIPFWTMSWMSEKNHQHGLDIAANLTRFFRPRWIWRLPLRLLLSLRVVTIYPCFMTGYDIGDEVVVVSGFLFEFPAEKREGPSGRRSAVLAQISQKCVSCSNCPPKCVERSRMTVLLSHKHRG